VSLEKAYEGEETYNFPDFFELEIIRRFDPGYPAKLTGSDLNP
jgi:hypothetical protein